MPMAEFAYIYIISSRVDVPSIIYCDLQFLNLRIALGVGTLYI
jgi:hypothetical protein